MPISTEKIYSKAQTRRELKISRSRYEQFIESGILPKPIELTPGSRPVHTETQILIANRNLEERAMSDYRETQARNRAKGYEPFKLSQKHIAKLQNSTR